MKSSSQNLREIEFVENMRVSSRNCREIWKQVSEIVEKGGFFQFVESRIKLLIGWARRWYAYEWLSHGHLMAQFDFILLCCFWFFTKELCIIIKIKVRECFFENQFTACHYKPGLVCFLPHFSLRVQLFFKRKKLQCYSWWSGITVYCKWNHSYSWRSVFMMHLHFHKICIKFCIIRIVQRFFISKY